MRNWHKIFIPAICLSLIIMSLTCPAMAKEGILTVAVSNPWATIDPMAWATGHAGLNQCYENLFRFKLGTLEVEPWLAESYELSPDSKTYTLHLKKGVKFHDGTPFTAEAVVFSFNRATALKQPGAAWLNLVEKVEVVDDFTVKFTLEAPSVIFLYALANPPVLRMVSPAVKKYEKNGDWAKEWLDSHEAGSGPYTVKEEVRNNYIYLERFKDYWNGWGHKKKHIEGALFKIVRESSSRKMMILNKEVQFAHDLLFEEMDELKKVPFIDCEARSVPANAVYLLRLTGGKDNPLTNRKVREAIAYAIDYKQMIEVAVKGVARQAQGPVPRDHYGHNYDVKIYQKDVNKAKALLKEAGYKPGEIKLIAMYNVGYDWKRVASESLMSYLNDIGIRLDLHTTTWPGLAASLHDGTGPPPPHMYIHYATGMVDALTLLRRMYHSESIGTWNTGYSNPEFDSALDKARTAPNLDKYKEYIFGAQRIWDKDLFCIPLWEVAYLLTYSKAVKGFVPAPHEMYDYNLYDMWLEE